MGLFPAIAHLCLMLLESSQDQSFALRNELISTVALRFELVNVPNSLGCKERSELSPGHSSPLGTYLGKFVDSPDMNVMVRNGF